MNPTPTDPLEEKPWIPNVGDWVIAKASYCGENDRGCTDATPCPECLEMCNRFVIAGEHYGLLFFHPQLCNRDGGCRLDETCCSIIATTPDAVPVFLKKSEGTPSKLSDFMPIPLPLESTNSNLAAEIAELKARLSNEERNADTLAKELATLRAELEAARKERESDDKTILRLIEERNTALAAKDAAEKKVEILAELNADLRARLNRVIGPVEKYCGIIAPVVSTAAVGELANPADTAPESTPVDRGEQSGLQVRILPAAPIPTEGGDEPCAHKEEASQGSSENTLIDKSGSKLKTTCASNSPDVGPIPTQGELKPFDLTEALAGAKVVTRDGRMVTFIRKWSDECCVKGTIDNQDYTWTTDGRWYVGETDSQADLFMLPTEGSGA